MRLRTADPEVARLDALDAVEKERLQTQGEYLQDTLGQWMRKREDGLEKYCSTCNIWRPPRASHCRICGHCMVRPSPFPSVCSSLLGKDPAIHGGRGGDGLGRRGRGKRKEERRKGEEGEGGEGGEIKGGGVVSEAWR